MYCYGIVHQLVSDSLVMNGPPLSCLLPALREDFRVQPTDVEVAVEEVAVMNCSPPVGHPEPNVTWRKDGVPINNTDPHYTVRPP